MGLVGDLGVSIFGFKGGSLGSGKGCEVRVESVRRISISYSCLSRVYVMIRHLTVADSCGVVVVSLSFFIVSSDNYL